MASKNTKRRLKGEARRRQAGLTESTALSRKQKLARRSEKRVQRFGEEQKKETAYYGHVLDFVFKKYDKEHKTFVTPKQIAIVIAVMSTIAGIVWLVEYILKSN